MLPTIGSCWKFVGTHGNSSLLFMMKVIGYAFCLQLSYMVTTIAPFVVQFLLVFYFQELHVIDLILGV
jgi:hypothetical protein